MSMSCKGFLFSPTCPSVTFHGNVWTAIFDYFTHGYAVSKNTICPISVKMNHIQKKGCKTQRLTNQRAAFTMFHYYISVCNGKMTMGYARFVIPYATAYTIYCIHIYTWLWLGPSVTPHMALIWLGVCCWLRLRVGRLTSPGLPNLWVSVLQTADLGDLFPK